MYSLIEWFEDNPIITMILFISGILLLVVFLSWRDCGIESRGLNLPYSWGPLQGCYVKINQRQSVKIERIRITSDGNLIVGSDNE